MRHLVTLAGFFLVLLSLIFVVENIIDSKLWQIDGEFLHRLLGILFGLAVIYAFSGCILATAWHRLIPRVGENDLSWRQAIALYGRTQVAKYLPGNVYHLVGRHAYGHMLGLRHRPQLIAVLLEVAFTILAAVTLIMLVWPLLTLRTGDNIEQTLTLIVSVLGVVLVVLAVLLLYRRTFYLRKLSDLLGGINIERSGCWQAYALYIIFFLISSALVFCLILAALDLPLPIYPDSMWPLVIFTTSVAWLLGFITPGASAGVGVREAVFIALLAPAIGSKDATLIAVCFRFVTVIGDLLYFLVSLALQSKPIESTPTS